MQILKNALKKSGPGDLEKQLARFLFHYRTTPHSTTGVTPAELLMGRPLRTHLDLLRPNISTKVHSSQESQKRDYDRKSKMRSFSINHKVFVRQSSDDSPWIPGTVIEGLGDLTYRVQLDTGRIECNLILDALCDDTLTKSLADSRTLLFHHQKSPVKNYLIFLLRQMSLKLNLSTKETLICQHSVDQDTSETLLTVSCD